MNDELNELKKLREGIDRLDAEVLARLNERARLAHQIGQIKKGVIYRPEREAQVLHAIKAANTGPLPDKAVQVIFREIMSACLGLEQPLTIGYLGPVGTFSEAAAKKHFGAAPNMEPLPTIDEVFRAVEAGIVHYGVVPVENSTEGAVARTLDLLYSSEVKVCGEVNLRIHQNLMSKAEGLDTIKRVYSHPQSLAQCHEWLNRHLTTVSRISVSSNAEAARLASQEDGAAAIAGEVAAQHYGLNILAASIEDDPNNTTRFLVIADHDAGPSGKDKTSFVCTAANKPGSMFSLLEPLAREAVSMTKFESRPARSGNWEYKFFVDIEGHRDEPNVAAALGELASRAGFMKVFGSYPRAVY